MGSRDRALVLVFLILVAWPDHWIRVAFVLLIAAFEIQTGERELEFRGFKAKPWERRVVCAFTLIMAVSKLVWWSVLCAAFCLGVRKFFKS